MSEAVSIENQITVVPLGPVIGAEISGVDLREHLDEAEVSAIHSAWLEHQVIFFRDQDLTIEQHIEFGRRFGDLHIYPNVPSHPEVRHGYRVTLAGDEPF